jgi:hypothetical protein
MWGGARGAPAGSRPAFGYYSSRFESSRSVCGDVGERDHVELREIEENFEIDRSIVSALKGAELADTTAAERRRVWAKHEGRNTRYIAEYLLPRLVRSIDRAWPEFVRAPSRQADFPSEKLRAMVESLAPWSVAWPLHDGTATQPDSPFVRTNIENLLFRRNSSGRDLPRSPCSTSGATAASSAWISPSAARSTSTASTSVRRT